MKKFRFFEAIGLIVILALTALAGISCAKAATGTLEGVTWVLKSYGDPGNLTTAVADKETTLTFNKEKKEVSGSGGVNGYGGNYEVNGNKLTVTGIIHTMMAAEGPIMGQENAFFRILESAQSYKIDGDQLTITGAEGTLVFSEK